MNQNERRTYNSVCTIYKRMHKHVPIKERGDALMTTSRGLQTGTSILSELLVWTFNDSFLDLYVSTSYEHISGRAQQRSFRG